MERDDLFVGQDPYNNSVEAIKKKKWLLDSTSRQTNIMAEGGSRRYRVYFTDPHRIQICITVLVKNFQASAEQLEYGLNAEFVEKTEAKKPGLVQEKGSCARTTAQ